MNGEITRGYQRTIIVATTSVVAVVAAVMLFLGAPDDSVDPTGSAPTSSGPATPSSTPGVVVSPGRTAGQPALPPDARAATAPGAEAFFRHYIVLYNYAYESLDPAPLMAVSDPSCKFCNSVQLSVDRSRKAGLTFEGGTVRVKALASRRADGTAVYLFNAILDQDSGRTVSADGTIIERTVPKQTNLEARVEWRSGGWVFRAGRSSSK